MSVIFFDSHKERGLTLTELMIVLLIFSLIIGAIILVLKMGRKSWRVGMDQIEIQQSARIGMVKMTRELRKAQIKEIVGESISFYLPVGVSGGVTLWGTDEIQYLKDTADLNNDGLTNQVLRGVVGDDDELSVDTLSVLANSVASIQFTLLPSAEEVNVTLTVQKQSSWGDPLTAILTSQVALRN